MSSVQCPHADRCGGCALIDLPYSVQLELKRDAVVAAVSRYPELCLIEPAPTLPAATIENYRTRAKLVVFGSRVGLYEKATHAVVDVPECRVLRPVVARAVDAVRRALPFRFQLLALDVREADSGALVTLIVPSKTDVSEVRAAAERLVESCPDVLGVSWSLRAHKSPTLLGSVPISLAGPASSPHRLEPGVPFHEAVPGSFVQAHAGQAGRLHAAIEQALETILGGLRGKRVVDLYAGGGALALRLAARGARVMAVDAFAPGLRELSRAAERQGLQLEVMALAAEQALASMERPDAVVVNPPRRGLSTLARHRLAALTPALVIYVSCEPNRLARDLAHLSHLGLGTRSLTPLDMIPLTDAVETLAQLTPEPAPAPRILYQDERWVAVAKPPHLALRAEAPRTQASLVLAVRKLEDLEKATAVQALEASASGVCVFARDPSHSFGSPPVLAAARFAFIALVAGITHKKGRLRKREPNARGAGHEARYVRERVVGTHSLLRVDTEQAETQWILERLSELGHPVIGDCRHGNLAGNRYFEARYGLDRPFLHCSAVELALESGARLVVCDLAPDLTAVLDELESRRAPGAPLAVVSTQSGPSPSE